VCVCVCMHMRMYVCDKEYREKNFQKNIRIGKEIKSFPILFLGLSPEASELVCTKFF
jgi:hypothetical protein